VRVSLVEARYGATFVDLRVRIENGGDSPLCVRRDGLLLGFGELEYPVDLDGEFHPPSPETIVEGGSASELALQFRLTRALVDSARLHFRDLELGGERFGPISVPVPPRPAPEPI
jgi:hypothetical protein